MEIRNEITVDELELVTGDKICIKAKRGEGYIFHCGSIVGYVSRLAGQYLLRGDKKNLSAMEVRLDRKDKWVPCILYRYHQDSNYEVKAERLKEKYRDVKISGGVAVVRDKDFHWGVVSLDGAVIVPFGKYGWIDSYDSGLARVRTFGRLAYSKNILYIIDDDNKVISGESDISDFIYHDRQACPEKYCKWGIINENGEEVLPLVYDEIWSFSGKNRCSTKVIKNGEPSEVYFHTLNPALPIMNKYQEDQEPLNKGYSRLDNYCDYERDTWDALTDGQYGDMPDGFNGDYDFLGF